MLNVNWNNAVDVQQASTKSITLMHLRQDCMTVYKLLALQSFKFLGPINSHEFS